MASAKSGTEIAARASTAVGQVIDYGDHAGQGFENQTRDDVAIPFISVLQALSPQLEKLEGAKAGMLINTVTDELHKGDEGLLFVPAVTQHVFVEWVPRVAGGGFVAVHDINSEVVQKAQKEAAESEAEYGKLKVQGKDGQNDLIETFYVYGVLVDDQVAISMAVVAFTSTKIKVYKKFNTRVRTHLVPTADGRRVNPPLFANLTRIKSFKDKNPKGEFYNFELVPAAQGDLRASLLPPSDPRFLAALDCKKLVESGVARAAFETQGSGGGGGDGEEKIPF